MNRQAMVLVIFVVIISGQISERLPKKRNQAAQRHNDAVNTLLKLQLGGKNEAGGTETRRFFKGRSGWNASIE